MPLLIKYVGLGQAIKYNKRSKFQAQAHITGLIQSQIQAGLDQASLDVPAHQEEKMETKTNFKFP